MEKIPRPEAGMSADDVLAIIDDGLDLLASLDGPRRDKRADVLLLAISGQEADWTHRVQRSRRRDGTWFDGPARGLWQFERAGGVAGVLQHRASAQCARALCVARDVTPESRAVWERLATDDILAAGFARLLLWTDPRPLPAIDDQAGAWRVYIDGWRPGKPHPNRWPACHRAALSAVARQADA
jgi:hypothetical protein